MSRRAKMARKPRVKRPSKKAAPKRGDGALREEDTDRVAGGTTWTDVIDKDKSGA
jgi:hypothetical protein